MSYSQKEEDQEMREEPGRLQCLTHMSVLQQHINSILMGFLLPLLSTPSATQVYRTAKKGSYRKTLLVDI